VARSPRTLPGAGDEGPPAGHEDPLFSRVLVPSGGVYFATALGKLLLGSAGVEDALSYIE
jgi:hypothetical protein